MQTILLNGINLGELLEKFGQLIDQKIGNLHPTEKKESQTGFITRKEAAKLLKISLPTLHEWTKLGWLQSYRIGTRILYKQQEIEASLHKVGSLKFKKGGSYGA